MLRKTLIAGLVAAGSAAHAQGVTIYGIADTGIERLTNVNAQGGSLVRMPNLTGLVPSRLGFRGNEDLGGGLNAFFNLEMGVALDSGSMNNGGRSFGRASNVGVAGPFGRVILGRQLSPPRERRTARPHCSMPSCPTCPLSSLRPASTTPHLVPM